MLKKPVSNKKTRAEYTLQYLITRILTNRINLLNKLINHKWNLGNVVYIWGWRCKLVFMQRI